MILAMLWRFVAYHVYDISYLSDLAFDILVLYCDVVISASDGSFACILLHDFE